MAVKTNRILITLIIFLLLLTTGKGLSFGQTATQISYLPVLDNNTPGWIGPYGGTIVPLAIARSNPQIVYAGTYGSGVYKSLDGGHTWNSMSTGLANLYIYSLAVDPSHPDVVYAGTYRSRVYKSTNGGASWYWSGSGMQDQAIVYSISIDPVSPNTVYASTRGISNNGNPPWRGVVYKSTNAGSTWTAILQGVGGNELQDWAYTISANRLAHNEIVIATHESGPWKSDDYGSYWYQIPNGIQDFSGRSIATGLTAEYYETYYYAVWHEDSIYKTTNSAVAWESVNRGYTYQHVYSIALDPLNGNNVFLGTFVNGILKSTDGGDSWQLGGLTNNDIYSIAIDPQSPSHMLASTAGNGVFVSENGGGSWAHSDDRIDNATVTAAIFSSTEPGTIYASLFGGGVYRSANHGETWTEINTGLDNLVVMDLVMDPAHPKLLYALTEAGLYKNDLNSGGGWIFAGDGLPEGVPAVIYPPDHPLASLEMQEAFSDQAQADTSILAPIALVKMVYAPSNPQVAYIGTAGSGVYRSLDGGLSWQAAGLSGETITGLAVDSMNPNIVFAITSTSAGMRVTQDGGANWYTSSLPETIYSLVASPTQTGLVYAGTSDGLYRYQSGGWTSLGITGQSVTAVQLDPQHPDMIYAGSDHASYYSTDRGQSWKSADARLSGQAIEAISVDPANPNLVLYSTKTHGIFLLFVHF